MKNNKKGASIISLLLCVIAITLVTTALVVATNNSARYRASKIIDSRENVQESLASVKIYTKSEVISVARQAFVNNYIEFYDGNVDLEGFRALVIGEMMQVIPINQLEKYDIHVTKDGVTVE